MRLDAVRLRHEMILPTGWRIKYITTICEIKYQVVWKNPLIFALRLRRLCLRRNYSTHDLFVLYANGVRNRIPTITHRCVRRPTTNGPTQRSRTLYNVCPRQCHRVWRWCDDGNCHPMVSMLIITCNLTNPQAVVRFASRTKANTCRRQNHQLVLLIRFELTSRILATDSAAIGMVFDYLHNGLSLHVTRAVVYRWDYDNYCRTCIFMWLENRSICSWSDWIWKLVCS